MASFKDFNLLPSIQKTLKDKGFAKPTEIQRKAIPALLAKKSVVGLAETGSGKTLSFAVPVLHIIKSIEDAGDSVEKPGRPRAVVVVPTRELGEQVSRVFKDFTHDTRIRVRTVLGGTTMEIARRNVSGPFEVLLATPGRMCQLMEKNLLTLSDTQILVLDEADQMLDQGFLPDLKRILMACPKNRQLAMFTATAPPKVQDLISDMFHEAEFIESSGHHRLVPTLKTTNRPIRDGKRFPELKSFLSENIEGGTIIFTNTREQCDKLALEMEDNDYDCVIYRGEMDKLERRANLKKFRDAEVEVLISTDLASRGLDVDHVGRVINYHLPQQLENYFHRAGRTARAGREGEVVNFITERDEPLMKEVRKLLK